MRVLLVNPTLERLRASPKVLPLGLAYIAGVLEKEGHRVKVIDLNIHSLTDLKQAIVSTDILGVTATTPLIYRAWHLCKIAKEIDAKVTTMVGGPDPTAQPSKSAERKEVDFVVRGEAEHTILNLISALEGRYSAGHVAGVSYRVRNRVIHNPNAPLLPNLDSIPFPALRLFPLNQYDSAQPFLTPRKTMSIVTSRGCPYHCAFCFHAHGYIYRERSPRNVVDEWHLLAEEYRAREIEVVDDNFALNVKRVEKICDLLMEEGLDHIPWACFQGVRVDHPDMEDLFRKMRKAGCYRIGFGIESGNPRILEKIKKQITLNQVERAVKAAKKAGLKVIGYFMIGNLEENEQTVRDTVKFARRVDCDYAQFTVAVPFPGTEMFRTIESKGRFLTMNWEDYGTFEGKAYYECGEVTKELVERMYKTAYKQLYLYNPRAWMRMFTDENYRRNIIRGVRQFCLCSSA